MSPSMTMTDTSSSITSSLPESESKLHSIWDMKLFLYRMLNTRSVHFVTLLIHDIVTTVNNIIYTVSPSISTRV